MRLKGNGTFCSCFDLRMMMEWVSFGLSWLTKEYAHFGRDRRLFCYSLMVREEVQVLVSSIFVGIVIFGVICY